MKKFFISYSRNDIAIAKEISKILEQYGFKGFADFNVLSSELCLADRIPLLIKESDLIFFVVSKSSIESQWCRREIEFAIHQGKTVIPILSEITEIEAEDSWLNNYISKSNYINWLDNGKDTVVNLLNTYRSHQTSQCPDNTRPNCIQTTKNRSPKSRKKSYKIGCVALLLIVIGIILGGIFFMQEPNPSAPGDSEVCYDPNTSQETYNPTFTGSSGCHHDSDSIMYNDSETSQHLPSKNNEDDYLSEIDEESNHGNIELVFGLSLLALIAILLYFHSQRKINIKIVANEDCEVKVDNTKYITISANTVESLKLKKGTYYLIFEPLDKSVKSKSVSHKVKRPDDLINITFEDSQIRKGLKTIKCFIAGSTKLEAERDSLRSAIAQTHNKWTGKNVEILSYTYEDFDRKVVEGGQQQLYNDFITNDATIAVFIISGEVGEFTISEFKKALDAYKTGKHPQILVFNNELAEYHSQAESLKKLVSEEKQYWVDYDSLKTLKLQFMSTLNWLLIDTIY